ncbi:PEP-CTERM/exosortase system-associated acyltransferase [Paraglaciecola sp.]|jgi:N-acyl amino acid synthase of PEP-CTERM/exosortase system|uniref:PEP-CTERM/exosortase system-associated acyltransferase n=1 Tax=Paraglaciecola sp. TaxID=1920173 RepID=UPI00273D1846|nr:PEP-CTERM/exosortase system-associated acyltransferase [Paraglaciecola sp.]MDP5032416.1 PEP-CTERM/exosortase system-associated acyltransferase [Paraglaciecola sp.]
MKHLKTLQKIPVVGGLVNIAISHLASSDASTISKHFSQFLRPELALSENLKREVYRLRHEVYCEELKFEDVRPDQEERDNFDEHSVHCFVRHVSSGRLAGTVRLITSSHIDEMLPIEKFCSHAIEDETLLPANFPREDICEISRLAVLEHFRRRQMDKFSGAATGAININDYSKTELRCFPYIAICLYLAAASTAFKTNKKHAYVMMEPRLARSMAFVGIQFKQLGKPIDYHGKRAAFYINGEMFHSGLSSGYAKLLKSIENDLFASGVPNKSHPVLEFFHFAQEGLAKS